MTINQAINQALLDGLRTFDRPATTHEIENAMPLGLSADPNVAVERCRTALMLRMILERDVRRLPDDRWELSS